MDIRESRVGLEDRRRNGIDSCSAFLDLAELLGENATRHLLRVSQIAIARVAEAAVVAEANRRQGRSLAGSAMRLDPDDHEMLAGAFSRLVEALVREQLMDATERLRKMGTGSASPVTVEAAVVFADLVGSTSWANEVGPVAHSEAMSRFGKHASEVAHANGGLLVKLHGDEAMFVAPDATTGCAIAFDMIGWCEDANNMPNVRCGLAHGEMITVDGDYYGPAVALAARLAKLSGSCQVAAPNEIVAMLHSKYRASSAEGQYFRGFETLVDVAMVERPEAA